MDRGLQMRVSRYSYLEKKILSNNRANEAAAGRLVKILDFSLTGNS